LFGDPIGGRKDTPAPSVLSLKLAQCLPRLAALRLGRVQEIGWVPESVHHVVTDECPLRQEGSKPVPPTEQEEQPLGSCLIEAKEELQVHHLFEGCPNERQREVPEILPREDDCRLDAFELATERRVDGEEPIVILHGRPFDAADLEQAVGEAHERFYRFKSGMKV
jgi:hypothetical protein